MIRLLAFSLLTIFSLMASSACHADLVFDDFDSSTSPDITTLTTASTNGIFTSDYVSTPNSYLFTTLGTALPLPGEPVAAVFTYEFSGGKSYLDFEGFGDIELFVPIYAETPSEWDITLKLGTNLVLNHAALTGTESERQVIETRVTEDFSEIELMLTFTGDLTDVTAITFGGAAGTFSAVPEPASLSLVGLMAIAGLLRRRR